MAKVIILGNGPAGISAALYTVRAGLDTTVLGKDGGALAKAEKIENYYGFPGGISGKALVEAGIAQAKELGVSFIEEEAVSLGFGESLFVKTTQAQYPGDCIILATGTTRAAPRIAGLRDLEGKGVSYCAVCDAFFYRGRSVAVLGDGEYARNEVEELLPVVGSVTLLTNGKPPAVSFPAGVHIIETPIEALEGENQLESARFADGSSLPLDGIFIAVGVAGSADLAKKIGAVTEGNKIAVDENMQTNIPGLYAAGDCTGGMLQIAKAVHDGAVAGTAVVKALRGSKQ